MLIRIKGVDGRTYHAKSEEIVGLVPAFTLEGKPATGIIVGSNAIVITGGEPPAIAQQIEAVIAAEAAKAAAAEAEPSISAAPAAGPAAAPGGHKIQTSHGVQVTIGAEVAEGEMTEEQAAHAADVAAGRIETS